jgi:hypothetical protein
VKRLVVACLLMCGLLGACGSGTDSDSAKSSDSADSGAATGELTYFNPTHLPAGYAIESTDFRKGGEAEEAAWAAKVGRASGAKKFRDLFTVLVTKTDPADDSSESGYTPVDVNGHAGKQADTPITGAIVMWKQDGFDVGVLGPPGKRDDALGVARAVRVNADLTKTRLEGLPSGLDVVAEWGSTGFPRTGYTINAETTDAKGSVDSVRIDVTLVPTDFPVGLLGAGHELDGSGKVRGHTAYVFRSANDIGGHTLEQFSVSWGERADLVVNVSGTIGTDELRAVAEGLKAEPEQQWRTHAKVK